SYAPDDDDDEHVAEELKALAQSAPKEPARREIEAGDAGSAPGASLARALPGVHSSAELVEAMQGRGADAPICFTCGTKMRPAGSCFVCEGCGSTSGCS